MATPSRPRRRPHPFWRGSVEIASITFLFYANLLMGEFTGVNGRGKTFTFAVHDIFTRTNFSIALVSAAIGYVVFEFCRSKLI